MGECHAQKASRTRHFSPPPDPLKIVQVWGTTQSSGKGMLGTKAACSSHQATCSRPGSLIKTVKSSARLGLRRLSQSPAMASRESPPWLQNILSDSTQPPTPYAWTIANLSGSRDTYRLPRPDLSSSQTRTIRRVFILGVGNLGRLYANCLSQLPDPPPITLVVHRRSLLEHWASHPGIELTRNGCLERSTDFDIEWWTDEKPTVGPVQEVANGAAISNLVVATKAADAIPQVDRLRRYLGDSSNVLFVQNGVNRLWPPYGATYIAHRYPGGTHPNFLHAVTMHGVFSDGMFKSVHAAPADVVIGPVCPSDRQPGSAGHLATLITEAPHLAARAVSKPELWILQLEKLVINMVINPLTAVLRVRNGELFADLNGVAIKVMDTLLEETSSVLQALVRHESSREILEGGNISMDELTRRLSAPELRPMLHRVGEKVKHNKSSMFQDVEAGKQTEIRDLNGWLVETARFLSQGLDVRSHKILINLVEQGVKLDEHELGKCLLHDKQ